VSCGKYHTLFLTGNGEVWVTGANDQGQLGICAVRNSDVNEVKNVFSPVRVESLTKRHITRISAWQSSAAISDDSKNNLFVWGTGIYGILNRPK
jgi:alpha-tubulin suppressor-like RCC1 family protein